MLGQFLEGRLLFIDFLGLEPTSDITAYYVLNLADEPEEYEKPAEAHVHIYSDILGPTGQTQAIGAQLLGSGTLGLNTVDPYGWVCCQHHIFANVS